MSTLELFPPHLRTHPDAAEFGNYLEDNVSMPEGTTCEGLCGFFDGCGSYAWEAAIPPRGEWERHADEFTKHLAAEYPRE